MVKKEKKKPKKKENSIKSTLIVVNDEGENVESDDAKQEESSFTKHEIKRIPEAPAITAAAQKHNKKDKTAKPKNKRMLILFRSAEQMDKIFPEWMHKNFIDEKYVPTDMNQLIQLPLRKTPLIAYASDPPLTEMGIRISQLIGKALTEKGIVISAIYSSPSLRCIQTAQNLIKSQHSSADLKICIEPAFYNFFGEKQNKLPIFMSSKELLENGIPINKDYRPITPKAHLSKFVSETPAEFFRRQSNNVYTLTKQSPIGTVLIVTHACTMHAIGCELIGKTQHSLNTADMARVSFNYPYCSGIALKSSSDGLWDISSQALPALYSSNFSNRFNYHFLARSG
uniref:Uncharacterized protein n=1 Tax=Panagrolaimus sp. PS1159 TaxID=55785 RepID=A0AC35GGG1_9BILA